MGTIDNKLNVNRYRVFQRIAVILQNTANIFKEEEEEKKATCRHLQNN